MFGFVEQPPKEGERVEALEQGFLGGFLAEGGVGDEGALKEGEGVFSAARHGKDTGERVKGKGIVRAL